LRRLDSVHGDRRTRLEKFLVIQRVAEQLLVRLDLATGVLGYIDPKNGRYVLNSQCNIAEDAGISAPVLCRLMKTLDDAGYVYRRIERVRLDDKDENGLHLVRTRVLIRFTKLFWRDLGLAYVHERAQKSAKKRRDAVLRDIGQQQLAQMEKHSLELRRREVSRQRWQSKEARETGAVHTSNPVDRSYSQMRGNASSRSGNDVLSSLDRLMTSVASKAK
jgi:hypothetical protein